MEYLINYRLSFMRFLGLGEACKVPAKRSIGWIQAEGCLTTGYTKGDSH